MLHTNVLYNEVILRLRPNQDQFYGSENVRYSLSPNKTIKSSLDDWVAPATLGLCNSCEEAQCIAETLAQTSVSRYKTDFEDILV